jgi:hypothetical protein
MVVEVRVAETLVAVDETDVDVLELRGFGLAELQWAGRTIGRLNPSGGTTCSV